MMATNKKTTQHQGRRNPETSDDSELAAADSSLLFGGPLLNGTDQGRAWVYGAPDAGEDDDRIPTETLIALTEALKFSGEFRELLKHGPFAGHVQAVNDGGPRASDLAMLQEIASFVGALAIGAATRADWGRLRRMHASLRTRTETKEAKLLELVRSSANWAQGDQVPHNLRVRLIDEVDPCFAVLTVEEIASVLANRRMGAASKAAEFALKSRLHGVSAAPNESRIEARERIAKRLSGAERKLRKA